MERSLLRDGHSFVAGVDEVGRGSWAGPLVAAAVILPLDRPHALRRLRDVRDSKLLLPEQRIALLEPIARSALCTGIGWVTSEEIDLLGLGPANILALRRAVENLSTQPHGLILDHFSLPECPLPQLSPARADSLSLSVAAASIVAKVTRDRWMEGIAVQYPGYGFETHKGYGTAAHRQALETLGPCAIHRRCFAPVARGSS